MILEHLEETYRRTHEGEQMDGIWAYSLQDGFDDSWSSGIIGRII